MHGGAGEDLARFGANGAGCLPGGTASQALSVGRGGQASTLASQTRKLFWRSVKYLAQDRPARRCRRRDAHTGHSGLRSSRQAAGPGPHNSEGLAGAGVAENHSLTGGGFCGHMGMPQGAERAESGWRRSEEQVGTKRRAGGEGGARPGASVSSSEQWGRHFEQSS